MRFTIAFLLLLAGVGFARDRPEPAVVTEILDLVHVHTQGQENVARDRQRIVIAYDAMTFHIHGPDMAGRLQRGYSEHGPNRDGVVIEVELSTRQHVRQMALPQWLSGPYYDTYCCELKEDDRYLFVRARFGQDFPSDVRRAILDKLGATRASPPPVRVSLTAGAKLQRFPAGDPIALTVTLRNGLFGTIRFPTKASTVVEEILRGGNSIEFTPPNSVNAEGDAKLAPHSNAEIPIDLNQWKIQGGWIPGEYQVAFRLDSITVGDKVTLSVRSDPVRFVIE